MGNSLDYVNTEIAELLFLEQNLTAVSIYIYLIYGFELSENNLYSYNNYLSALKSAIFVKYYSTDLMF